MKKIFIFISFVLIMILFGCSAATQEATTSITTTSNATYITTTANISPDLIYFSEDLTFSNVDEDSFLNYIVDDYQDIRIILDLAYSEGDVLALPETIDSTLDTLERITNASGISLKALINHSFSTLNDIAKNNDVTLTVQDIVGFNDIKDVVAQLSYSYRLTIEEYLEARLQRPLTQDEANGVNTFYWLYMSLVWNSDSYDLSGKTAEQFILDVSGNQEVNFNPTEYEEIIITAVINVLYEIDPEF